jgi:hypothetical protein
MRGARFRAVDLSGARFQGVDLTRAAMRGVELVDVSIDGEIQNVTINGVDVAPLMEAELDPRCPDRSGCARSIRQGPARAGTSRLGPRMERLPPHEPGSR